MTQVYEKTRSKFNFPLKKLHAASLLQHPVENGLNHFGKKFFKIKNKAGNPEKRKI